MFRLRLFVRSSFALCFCLATVLAQSNSNSGQPHVGSAITGKVVAQGKPVQGAVITLWQGYSEPSPNGIRATGRTDAAGVYHFADVAPGNYFIQANATGFVTGKENHILLDLRHVIIAGSNPVDPINFELVPEGVIKGTVTDADGQAIARVPITIFPEPVPEGDPRYARDIRTDVQGNYRVVGIPAGRYRIAAGYQPVTTATITGRVGYKRVFYPDATEETNARVIEIAPGTEVSEVNINLGHPVKTFTVRATILDSQNGKPVEDLDYNLAVFSNGKRIGGTSTRARSNSRGEITIENVPPGEYSISVPGMTGVWPAGDIPPARNIFGESKHFEVTDSDIGEIEIRVVRAATVSGFVVIEGAAGMDVLARVPEMHIMAMVTPKPGGANPLMRTNIKPDGSFTFTGLMPGKLQFNFAPTRLGGLLPLRLVRVERDGIRLDQDPEIELGDQITGLRVVLGYANSSIHGVVKLDSAPLPPGVTGRAAVLQYGKVVSGGALDPHGEFVLENLSAGEYTLAVFARRANSPEWHAERQIIIPDNKVSEVTMLLDSTGKAATNSSSGPVTPH